jgi:hypothetical protein
MPNLESSAHRRSRRLRSGQRLLAQVTAACTSLHLHHGSAPPRILRPLLAALDLHHDAAVLPTTVSHVHEHYAPEQSTMDIIVAPVVLETALGVSAIAADIIPAALPLCRLKRASSCPPVTDPMLSVARLETALGVSATTAKINQTALPRRRLKRVKSCPPVLHLEVLTSGIPPTDPMLCVPRARDYALDIIEAPVAEHFALQRSLEAFLIDFNNSFDILHSNALDEINIVTSRPTQVSVEHANSPLVEHEPDEPALHTSPSRPRASAKTLLRAERRTRANRRKHLENIHRTYTSRGLRADSCPPDFSERCR